MGKNEVQDAKKGRPPKSPRGKRLILHISISPEAGEAIKAICERPISPISTSAMIEHLIMEARGHIQTPV